MERTAELMEKKKSQARNWVAIPKIISAAKAWNYCPSMVGTPLVGEQSEYKTLHTITRAQINIWLNLISKITEIYCTNKKNISIMQDIKIATINYNKWIVSELNYVMQRFNITITFPRMKRMSIKIQLEFCQKVILLSLLCILPPQQTLMPCQ